MLEDTEHECIFAAECSAVPDREGTDAGGVCGRVVLRQLSCGRSSANPPEMKGLQKISSGTARSPHPLPFWCFSLLATLAARAIVDGSLNRLKSNGRSISSRRCVLAVTVVGWLQCEIGG